MHADPPIAPYRDRFHDALERLETDVQAQGARVRVALARATRGLVTGNVALCGAVVTADDEVDRRYLDIERQVVDLLGRHAPVAADLRLLTAILHINRHLERIGDMAVNVARLGQAVADAPRSQRWTSHLEQMSEHAVWMVELAMQAFGARNASGSQRLPALDERVDELNRCLLAATLAPRQPLDQLAWVVYLHDAGRQLERAADHAVDIAEQVWFLVTGELCEFDSVPRVPAPGPEHPGATSSEHGARARRQRAVRPYRAWLASRSIKMRDSLLTKGVFRCRRKHGNGAVGWGCGWPLPWSSAT
jgi:phosphate transport system protein